jgi:hypothetical protein
MDDVDPQQLVTHRCPVCGAAFKAPVHVRYCGKSCGVQRGQREQPRLLGSIARMLGEIR